MSRNSSRNEPWVLSPSGSLASVASARTAKARMMHALAKVRDLHDLSVTMEQYSRKVWRIAELLAGKPSYALAFFAVFALRHAS